MKVRKDIFFLTDLENKLVVTSGERDVGRNTTGVEA